MLKFIIEPYYKKLDESKEDSQSDEDNQTENADKPEEESEYVYHNGRMVHRSVLEQENLFND